MLHNVNAAINAAIQSVRLITFIMHTNKCMIYFDAKIYTMLVMLIQIYRIHYICVCVYISYIYIYGSYHKYVSCSCYIKHILSNWYTPHKSIPFHCRLM